MKRDWNRVANRFNYARVTFATAAAQWADETSISSAAAASTGFE